MKMQLKNIGPLIACLCILAACTKNKTDFEYDNRPVTQNRKKSNVRLINLAGFNQVIANGDSLTNFMVKDRNDPDGEKLPGTDYFPSNGKLGKVWEIPLDLFDAKESLKLDLALRSNSGLGNPDYSFTAKNDYSAPTDYFLLQSARITGQPAVVPVVRGVTAPSKPGYFKIRIINLTAGITSPGFNSSGPLEDLRGTVTLSYADGTPVNDKTTNISAGTRLSEYIELPYGTYQFKVLTADGRQLPAAPSSGQDYNYTRIDPPTSTIPMSLVKSSNLVFAPVDVYQPGGIYTVVVTPQVFNYYINEVDEETVTLQNSFQVINDNSAPANVTYCRLQGANAWNAQKIDIKTNGRSMTAGIGFGEAGDYNIMVQGIYTIEATDVAGKQVAKTEQELRPGQNYTAWLYANTDGSGKLLMVANDLSGAWSTGNIEDATYDGLRFKYYFNKRFLNLTPDNPYITFTLGNGQNAAGVGSNVEAGVNLRPGIPVIEQPYVASTYGAPLYEVMTYRSAPNIVPGTWASDIPVLSSQDFIARKSLYTSVGRRVPNQEPGVYTVALIGTNNNGATKAKMMILKHNK